jgi:hypothetical protein
MLNTEHGILNDDCGTLLRVFLKLLRNCKFIT